MNMTSNKSLIVPTDNNVVMLDSLPYVEQTHNDYEEYALALIEDEMNTNNKNNNHYSSTNTTRRQVDVAPPPPIKFRSPLMETEYKTLINIDNDEVVGRRNNNSNSFIPPKIARPSSIDEWKTHAIPTAKQRFEAERIRSMILEAEKEDAVQNWKLYNKTLDSVKTSLTTALTTTCEQVEEINYQRQKLQTDMFGPQLQQLTIEHQQMLYRRNQLVHSIEGLKRSSSSTMMME
jgi:Breast carcinoma amplified sequence 2 (BCAS2)